MRKRILAFVLCVGVLFSFAVVPSSSGFAGNSDEKYDGYKNIIQENTTGHAKYIVPNLYRQDASYTNVKTFPLVVKDSVAYFPLDIFALYSYLEVVYSRIAYGFYINNTKNNHYVAFDMETGTTTTHDSQLTDVKAQIFNRTYYVPAQIVCETLGMNFEFYDSPGDGIVAARISDGKAKMTLEELVELYSPVKKEDETTVPDEPKKDDVPTVPETPPPQTEKPAEDPYLSVGARTVYLTFDGHPNAYTADILDLLDNYGQKAMFFLEKDKILEYPDTARRIITDGHSVGISFYPKSEQGGLLSNENIEETINEANNALCLVSKCKTRFIRAKTASAELSEAGFYEYAKDCGFAEYSWTTDVSAYTGNANSVFEKLKSDIIGRNPSKSKTVCLRFSSGADTAGVLEKLLSFCREYRQFKIETTDEYTPFASLAG